MLEKEDQTFGYEVVYRPTITQDNSCIKLKMAKPSPSFLYFAGCTACLLTFTGGTALSWTSPVLPRLTIDDAEINPLGHAITSLEESWIASLACFGGIFGATIAGWMADTFGRKRSLLIISLPLLFSFLILAFTKTVFLYCIGRFSSGLSLGSALTVLPMYLSEISEDHNRGTLGCLLGISISCGLLFSYCVGPYISVQLFSLTCLIPLLVFLPVFLIFVPESPQYLARNQRNNELEKSLSKLRRRSISVIQKEKQIIVENVLKQNTDKISFGALLKTKSLRRGFFIIIGIVVIQQFAGINAVLAYMQTIFDSAGTKLSPEISTIIVGTIQLISTAASSVLVETLGRRLILLFSTFGSLISLISLGTYFYLKNNNYSVDAISWLPVTSLIVYIVAFNIGLGPLPWVVMAELFPSNVKSTAATMTSFTCFGGGFLIVMFFPYLSEFLGMAGSFWAFAVVCSFGTVFIYFTLPETKGKSINEIQRLLEIGSTKK